MPDRWTRGQDTDICVDFYNIHIPALVRVNVTSYGKENFSHIEFMESSGCFKMRIPPERIDYPTVIFKVSSILYNYTNEKEPIYLSLDEQLRATFIQTDKPIYKPGEKVRFRILSIYLPQLTPIIEKIDRVYMVTSGAIRVLQQDNVTTTLGLAELDFQLGADPPLGTWSIFVENSAGIHKHQFKVDQYVPIKWNVTLEAPTSIRVPGVNDIKVCAKYFYGKPVQGIYSIEVSTKSPDGKKLVVKSFTGQLDGASLGCATIKFNSTDLEGSQSSTYLLVEASVTEKLTGKMKSVSKRINILPPFGGVVFNEQTPKYFKYGSPFPAQVVISDYKPGQEVLIRLWSLNLNNFFYSAVHYADEHGKLTFLVPTIVLPENTTYAMIDVSVDNQLLESRQLKPWYSESRHFITVVPPFDSVPCKGSHSFRIYHNASPGTVVHYMFISKGIVIKTGVRGIPRSFPLSFNDSVYYYDMNFKMSPLLSGRADLFIYYVTESREFIADFLKFQVQECFLNEVTFNFDRDEGEPGDQVMYTLSAASDSLCSVGVIDRSLEILAGNAFILNNQVFEIMKKLDLFFNSDQFGTNGYCKEKINEGKESDSWWCPHEPRYWSNYVDSTTAIQNVGLFALSDLVLQTRPCEGENFCLEDFPMKRSARSINTRNTTRNADPPTFAEAGTEIRKLFPETFLWKLIVLPESGKVSESVRLPDAMTEWYGSAVCVNEYIGMGISNFTSIRTFKAFSIFLDLPHSIVRGEAVHIPVVLFNYLPTDDQCLAVNIKMEEQSTFEIEGPTEYTVCSCGQQSLYFNFTITPTVIGQIHLQVAAKTVDGCSVCEGPISLVSASDVVLRTLPVKPEGIEVSRSFLRLLCAPDSVSANLSLPDKYVDGSERGEVRVVGNVIAPALLNFDKSITRSFYGTIGDEMAFIGYVATALNYLDTIGKTTPDIKSKALDIISSGYQTILNFRHPNGAYRNCHLCNDSNSLTGLAIRALAVCDQYIFIDAHVQEASIEFIKNGQDEDGCFPEVGPLFDRHLTGGLANSSKPVSLTAFLLISLLEAGESTNSEAITSGFGCLDGLDISELNTYALALSAYAYTLYGNNPTRQQEIMKTLEKKAITKGFMKHWSRDEKRECTYPWLCGYSSYDVKVTAYVLLAMVTDRGINAVFDGLPVVMWLTAQRYTSGTWYTSQDTFVALQALSKYAVLVTRKEDEKRLDVNFDPPGVTFHVDQTNELLLQSSPVDVPNNISISLSGTGCALVQASIWYNIIPAKSENPFFDVVLNVTQVNDCRLQAVDICLRYARGDGPTGTTVVQVKLPTGWDVDTSSLPSETEDQSGRLRQTESDELTFYFDEFTSTESCFNFTVSQEIKVDNVKAGHVTVFDHDDVNKRTSVEYNLTCS